MLRFPPRGMCFPKQGERRLRGGRTRGGQPAVFPLLSIIPFPSLIRRRTGRFAPLFPIGTERNTRGRSGGSSAQTVLPLTPRQAGASYLGRVQQRKSIRKNRCAKPSSLHTVTAGRPRLPAPAQKATDATLSHRKFFHSMWRKFGCGRGQPVTSLGGGDSQEGAKRPLLCACGAQPHISRRPQAANSPAAAPWQRRLKSPRGTCAKSPRAAVHG